MRFSGKQKVSHSLDELNEKKKTKLSKDFKSIDAVLFNWLESKVIEKKILLVMVFIWNLNEFKTFSNIVKISWKIITWRKRK